MYIYIYVKIMYITNLDLPRGAAWMIRGAYTTSLSVQTAHLGWCWYMYIYIYYIYRFPCFKSSSTGCPKQCQYGLHPWFRQGISLVGRVSTKTWVPWGAPTAGVTRNPKESWLTERQMMIGMYKHLRNERYLGSKKPFSVSVSQDP